MRIPGSLAYLPLDVVPHVRESGTLQYWCVFSTQMPVRV